jgi:flavin reductase (DIM6/NTAB) family NADH-FMN oxidoreductase RutF
VRSSRPQFAPPYGISADTKGMLDWSWATERLSASRNYWIVSSTEDGRPHAMPVWGLWFDDAVVFGTSPQSRKGRNLVQDPRVVVHLESGDEVVILEGEVERITLNEAIADAYGAKYEFRPDPAVRTEGWFRLRPRIAYAWREQEYPSTATRFAFE